MKQLWAAGFSNAACPVLCLWGSWCRDDESFPKASSWWPGRGHQEALEGFPSAVICTQDPQGKVSHSAWMLSSRVAKVHPQTVPEIRVHQHLASSAAETKHEDAHSWLCCSEKPYSHLPMGNWTTIHRTQIADQLAFNNWFLVVLLSAVSAKPAAEPKMLN